METQFRIEKVIGTVPAISERMGKVMRMFGVTADRLRGRAIVGGCDLKIAPGQICFITGPSGSGKSTTLNAIWNQSPAEERLRLEEIGAADNRSAIDGMKGDTLDAMRSLCLAGLSDVFCMLRKPTELSDGQRWRYRLARALSDRRRMIFVDEFASNLDRLTAMVVAFRLREMATKSGKMFFLAASQDDLIGELLPDVIVRQDLNGKAEVIRRNYRPAE